MIKVDEFQEQFLYIKKENKNYYFFPSKRKLRKLKKLIASVIKTKNICPNFFVRRIV